MLIQKQHELFYMIEETYKYFNDDLKTFKSILNIKCLNDLLEIIKNDLYLFNTYYYLYLYLKRYCNDKSILKSIEKFKKLKEIFL